MSFPLSVIQKFYIPEEYIKSNKLDIHSVFNLIYNKLSTDGSEKLKQKNSEIRFYPANSLFHIPYEIKISFKHDNLGIYLILESRMDRFIRIILVVTVLSAFLSLLSIQSFLIFSVLFTILFYIVNVIVIQNNNENYFTQIFGVFDFDENPKMIRLQNEWMKDVNRCPACGTFVGAIDINCPKCDLKVKQDNSIPLSITKFKEKTVKYIYREQKT